MKINNFLLGKIIDNEKNKILQFEKLYFIPRDTFIPRNSIIFYKKSNVYKYENKYYIYYFNILNNGFLSPKQLDYLINIFIKYQKTFFAIRKLINIYKCGKYKCYGNDLDLIGNNFNDLENKHHVTIVQNKIKYRFRASDLLNIIRNSLLNCSNMKPFPQPPKNPYLNIKFTDNNLYNIYFQIKLNTILEIPDIINKYFKYLFSINILKYMEYNYLFNNSIQEYIKNMPIETFYFELKFMFKKDKLFKKYKLNYDNLNEHMLIKLKEILKYYILFNNIIHPLQKEYYKKTFIGKAKSYIKNNEKKIRKYYKVKK